MKMPTFPFRSGSMLALLVVIVTSFASRAQYAIKQSSFSTIGSKSTGGAYSVRSSVTQPAASSRMKGGTFSLQGNPWNVVLIQSAGAPLLSINAANGLLRVSWPSGSPGFLLQETSELRTAPATTPWANSTRTVADNGAEKSVTITPGPGMNYFRLQRTP